MISALLKYEFLQNAVLSAVLASIVCGIIGTIVIEKKFVMMSGGIAHTSFGGIGMGYFLQIEPIIGALIFAVLAAIGITMIKHRTNTNSDTLIGIFWAMGMALGILFIAFTPGYPPDLASYLFGDILTVTRLDLNLMFVLTGLVVFIVVSLFNYWKAFLFDSQFTTVLGVNTTFLDYFLFILIALTVVVLIRLVGIILIIALLTVPPAVAKLFTYNLKKMMLLSIVLGILFSFIGLWFSYQFDIASGASIILIAGISYIMVVFLRQDRLKAV